MCSNFVLLLWWKIHPTRHALSLAEAERQAIERALAASGGNKTQAARILGITPKTLNAKLSLYNKE